MRAILRVMYWLSLRTARFPERMTIVDGLEPLGREDYGSGGLNDVLRGVHQGTAVAVKRPRVFGMVRPSHKRDLEDVRWPPFPCDYR